MSSLDAKFGVFVECGMDIEVTLKRFSNNQQLLEKFIKRFVDDPCFKALEDAVISLDHEEILKTAHTLKGLAGNLGFEALSMGCENLVASIRGDQLDQMQNQFAHIQKEYHKVLDCISRFA